MDQSNIRRRLAILRETREVSQANLASVLGFNDRQTLSDIESGKRAITFEEIDRAANHFGVDVDYFTDPLQLAGEARFSWRTTQGDLDAFEAQAGGWIATYRHLSRLKGESINSSLTQVGLDHRSTFEDAWLEGEAVSKSLGLGDVPALKLAQVLEEKQDTLVLNVEAGAGISGAACQLGSLNTIIINRREYEGRRNFDLAHELFHLITWEKMPPRRIDSPSENLPPKVRRIEYLADNFAAGLLMPTAALDAYRASRGFTKDEPALAEWIRTAASHFRVSGDAMRWRVACVGWITQAAARRLDAAALRVEMNTTTPLRFSRRFVETIGWGMSLGHISVRRTAQIMGTSVDDLADLFSEHGLKCPFDL